ncbi:MAG: hypothetical protein IPO83_13375 [Chitinophagaceae bacterium]|nr:hypothetical protein [Chitinophagaceae bacterium]
MSMKTTLVALLFTLVLIAGSFRLASAQCAMCKQSAESSLKEGSTDAKGLNIGIMYLLVIPYALVGGIGYYWYVNHKKKSAEDIQE